MVPTWSLGVCGPKTSNSVAEITDMVIPLQKGSKQSNLFRQGASSMMRYCSCKSMGPQLERMPMLRRVGDAIWTRGKPMEPVSSKLCRTGQAASKARRELSENLTSERLNCLRTGKWSPLASFPFVKPQPPKLTA